MNEPGVRAQACPGWPTQQAAAAVALVKARVAVAEAAAAVVVIGEDVADFSGMGTADLPAALSTLDLAVTGGVNAGLYQIGAVAVRVAEAFTATPVELVPAGLPAVELGGAVIMLRAALMDLDAALVAAAAVGLSELA